MLGCHEGIKRVITKDDFAVVRPGRYPGYTIPFGESEIMKGWKSRFDDDQQLLNLVVQRVYPLLGDLHYRYTSTRFDRENNRTVVRYFGRVVDDPVIAGYQIQFVFDAKNKLIMVCVSSVPLE